ncbi:MAG: trigger factor [Planctomycetes bacterium]|nr:trigger factor [Planctomycetota bacterium]
MADEKQEDVKEETKEEIKDIVTIEDCGPCKKKVSIEILEEKIAETIKGDYDELRKEAVVPGFRKGRAPLRLLEKKFGEELSKQVKIKLLADASDAAVKDNELNMMGDPDIDYENIDLPESGSLKFEFEVEVRPEFDLPEMEGIAVDKPKITFGDEEIDEAVMSMRKRSGIMEPKDGAVEVEDQVIANVVMDIEDVEEDEKRENIEISVVENGNVAGIPVENLCDLLVGAKSGDKKTTNVEVASTFYNEQYRGKKIAIEIDVKDVKHLVPAELDEAFFERLGVDDEDELRDRITESMEQQADRDARTNMSQQIQQYLVDNTTFDLPESIIAEHSSRVLQREYTNMLIQGRQREEIEQQMGQLRASSEDQAKEQLKQFFIMAKVADKFEVEVTEEEINGHIAQVAAYRGKRPEKMREELSKDGSLAQFSLQIREEKCIDKILESATITEIDQVKEKPAAKKKTAKKTAKKKAAPKAEKAPEKPAAKKTSKKTAKKKDEGDIEAKREATKTKRKKAEKKE